MQFLLVVLTFNLGLVCHGGVTWPSWSFAAQDFNLINNFTFIIQLGAGLPALASLFVQPVVLEHLPGLADFFVRHPPSWLAGVPQHPYYELGSYYLIVAGAINYFAACNLHDRIIHPQKRFLAQEQGAPESPAEKEEGKATGPSKS